MTDSLRRHFGHTAFRLGQEAVVRADLDGRDVLAVMPTGSGKSLVTRLSTTGLLRDCAPRLIEQWIESARAAALIAISTDQYRTLTVTPLGWEVMAGRVADVRMIVPAAERRRLTRPRRRRSRWSQR